MDRSAIPPKRWRSKPRYSQTRSAPAGAVGRTAYGLLPCLVSPFRVQRVQPAEEQHCARPASHPVSPRATLPGQTNGEEIRMKAPVIAMMLSLGLCAPALAATFVYVSNADDGDIGTYTLQAD